MLLATNYLSEKKYLKYKKKGVNIFLFNEINFSTDNLKEDTFLNCNSEKVPSTWYTWDENDKLLQVFKRKYPQFFNWNGYDMTLVFQKMLFWTNYKTGFLWYCKEKFYPNEEVCHIDPLHSYSIIKSGIRYLRTRFSYNESPKAISNVQASDKYIGIHLKDDFELGLYEHFLKQSAETGQYRLFYEKDLNHENKNRLGLKGQDITHIDYYSPVISFPKINPITLKGAEWFVLTALIRHWDVINKWMFRAQQISASGIKKILVNEAENGIYGACFGEVMKKQGIKMYNTMNGLKAGQAQDAFINFDRWFVWDEQMKKMLMEKCGLDEKRLLVAGHMMEDFAEGYVNQYSFGISRERLEGKKVISVFSIRTKRETKLLSLAYLYELVKNNTELFLIIRPHPAEKPEDYVLPDFESDRIHWVNYNQKNSKTTLYDQICASDVCIVYGSTVALECKWFGTACITFEPREHSLLYFADGHETVHVNNMEAFKAAVKFILDKKQEIALPQTHPSVATKMIEYLRTD